jgi:hypothetical protein
MHVGKRTVAAVDAGTDGSLRIAGRRSANPGALLGFAETDTDADLGKGGTELAAHLSESAARHDVATVAEPVACAPGAQGLAAMDCVVEAGSDSTLTTTDPAAADEQGPLRVASRCASPNLAFLSDEPGVPGFESAPGQCVGAGESASAPAPGPTLGGSAEAAPLDARKANAPPVNRRCRDWPKEAVEVVINHAKAARWDEVQQALDAGFPVWKRTTPPRGRFSLLHHAALQGHSSMVRRLLATGHADPNCINTGFVSPTMLAASRGHLEALVALVEAGGFVDRVPNSNYGATAIASAVRYGHVEVVRYLAGLPEVDLCALDRRGRSLLDLAGKGGPDVRDVLLQAQVRGLLLAPSSRRAYQQLML